MIEITNQIKEYKLKNKNNIAVVQIAPAVRVSIGEYLAYPAGANVIGKLISSLKEIGFDYVFDTNVGADLTILEEAHELVDRIQNNKLLPMFTTCCPTWYRFIERCNPEMIGHLSTTKSPQAILSSVIKTYFASEKSIEPANIFSVVIAPCLAKKEEAKKQELWVHKNIPNIDLVLTTKELAEVISNSDFDFKELPEESFDKPLGNATGAGAIFGTTGGVMEAALRTAYFYLTGKDLEDYNLTEVRNVEQRKEASIKIDSKLINIATINGLQEAKKVIQEIKEGKCKYHFIEVMACPKGCIGGPGQGTTDINVLNARREALFEYDKEHEYRASHQNPDLQKFYKDFIGEVGNQKAHEIMHISYKDRSDEEGVFQTCNVDWNK